MKNRAGEKAQDFGFVSATGNFPYTDDPSRIQTIYSLKTPYLLLFFSNPGCPNCRDVIQQLLNSALLSEMIQRKDLVHTYHLPRSGLEPGRITCHSYRRSGLTHTTRSAGKGQSSLHLKAIPTLYLLDANKTVLVKDAPPQHK
jgi:thioredoxin-related protein